MPGQEGDRRAKRSMRQGNPRVGRCSERGSHARNDLKADALLVKKFNFFTTSTKNKGIATFQTHHLESGFCLFQEDRLNLTLRNGMLASAFADINFFGIRTRPFKQGGVGELVIDNCISFRNEFPGTHRQKAEITWTRPDKINNSFGFLIHSPPINSNPSKVGPLREQGFHRLATQVLGLNSRI